MSHPALASLHSPEMDFHGHACLQSGEAIVTEWRGGYISRFGTSGEKLQTFGIFGADEGQFRYPRGVTVDHEGSIYVADKDNIIAFRNSRHLER